MGKLKQAVQKQKGGTGPDNIPLSFPKLLGPLALQQLLSIFNASFHSAGCPHTSGVVMINALLEVIKSRNDVALFNQSA